MSPATSATLDSCRTLLPRLKSRHKDSDRCRGRRRLIPTGLQPSTLVLDFESNEAANLRGFYFSFGFVRYSVESALASRDVPGHPNAHGALFPKEFGRFFKMSMSLDCLRLN